ncbi:Protein DETOXIFICATION 8, partial [Mucuna pruriens]
MFECFMDKLLIFLGQDDAISIIAGKYCIWLIPALFGYAVLQALVRYFHTQSLIFHMLVTLVVVVVLHIPICWVLVFDWNLDKMEQPYPLKFHIGSLSYYLYFTQRSNALRISKKFFFLAFPSVSMLCLHLYVATSFYFNILKWWSFELLVILVGLLPNPNLKLRFCQSDMFLHDLIINLNICNLHYFITYEISATISTRFQMKGKPQATQEAICSILVLALTDAIILNSVLFFFCFNDMEVVHFVAKIIPLLCLFVSVDAFLGTRAIVNLVTSSFGLNFNGRDLWIGILTRSTLQTITFALLTTFTNWEK